MALTQLDWIFFFFLVIKNDNNKHYGRISCQLSFLLDYRDVGAADLTDTRLLSRGQTVFGTFFFFYAFLD